MCSELEQQQGQLKSIFAKYIQMRSGRDVKRLKKTLLSYKAVNHMTLAFSLWYLSTVWLPALWSESVSLTFCFETADWTCLRKTEAQWPTESAQEWNSFPQRFTIVLVQNKASGYSCETTGTHHYLTCMPQVKTCTARLCLCLLLSAAESTVWPLRTQLKHP